MVDLVQFDRTARITIAEPGDPFGLEVEFAKDLGLRIAFEVLKTNDLQPNTGAVTIYNLAEDTRSSFTGKVARLLKAKVGLGVIGGAVPDVEATAAASGAAYCKLSAGYGTAAAQILEGTATTVESTRRGNDWRTTLTFGDGELGLRAGSLNQVFAPGTAFDVVIKFLIDSLGVYVDPAVLAQGLAGSASVRTDFPKGVTLTGSARAALEQFLAFVEVRASIQDGEFLILKDDSTTDDLPVRLGIDNGLLEQPRPLEDGGYEVSALLTPELSPGRPVILDSKIAQGNFRVEQVNHRGDTHGAEWHSTAELADLSAIAGI